MTRRSDPSAGKGTGTWRWSSALPALTFLVGIALGVALGISVTRNGDAPAPQATESRSASPSPAPTASVTVAVAKACIRAGRSAAEALVVLRRGVDAIRDLDAGRLQGQLDEMQRLQRAAEADARACSAAVS
jgi:hypothetical protein